MNDSILLTVRKLIGPNSDYDVFDDDLIVHINSFFEVLTQCGVGPENGFRITGPTEKWSDFTTDGHEFDMVKQYITLRTRLAFDPPASSFAMDAMKKIVDEMEWRMYIRAEEIKRET